MKSMALKSIVDAPVRVGSRSSHKRALAGLVWNRLLRNSQTGFLGRRVEGRERMGELVTLLGRHPQI